MLVNPPISPSVMSLPVFELCPGGFFKTQSEQSQARCSPRVVSPKLNHRLLHPVLRLKQTPLTFCLLRWKQMSCSLLYSQAYLTSFFSSSYPLLITTYVSTLPQTCASEHFSPDVMWQPSARRRVQRAVTWPHCLVTHHTCSATSSYSPK